MEQGLEQNVATPLSQLVGGRSTKDIQEDVVDAMRRVYDPEIPVSIYELGLIYRIDVAESGDVEIDMTLTSPACPVAGTLPVEVQLRAEQVAGVAQAKVEVVWDPPWTPDKMTEAAKLELNLF